MTIDWTLTAAVALTMLVVAPSPARGLQHAAADSVSAPEPPAGEPYDSAQTAEPPAGELYDSIQSRADPTQSYALYLPPGYSADRAWPLLVLMDPRGRALVPMAAVRKAAERYGYLAMSSYNTASDTGVESNAAAFDAMLADAQEALALDGRRLYLVGLSGTARVAWDYGFRLGDHVAGVLGVGAGHEPSMVLPVAVRQHGRPFAFFGTAGVVDFNYEELRALDRRLDELDFPHRIEYFDGGHEWPPEAVFGQALEWFQLQAMGSGYLKPDEAWISAVASRRLEAAARLEAAGSPREALRAYRTVADDFPELVQGIRAAERADELGGDPEVRAALLLEDLLGEEDTASRAAFWEFVEAARGGDELDSDDVLRTLDVAALRARARGVGEEARAAQRLLEYLFVVAAFYEPDRYLAEDALSRAQAFLEVAGTVKPDHPWVCLGLSRVHARAGRTVEGLEALACAADGGAVSPETLATHPDFESLRGEAGFSDLVERARQSSGGGAGS